MRRLSKNIYAAGGNMDDLYGYLFNEEDDAPATAPSQDELPAASQPEEQPQDDSEYNSTLQMAMDMFSEDPHANKRQYQTAPHGSEFQSFGTPEEGRQALENQLSLYQTGKTRNPVGPQSSILDAMSVYAPAADRNNPAAYAAFVAKRLGVPVSTPISQIDKGKWADAISAMEGNKTGNNPGNLRKLR